MHSIPQVRPIDSVFRSALAVSGLCAILVAAPGAARGETAWMCNLSDDAVRLYCVADVDPGDAAEATHPVKPVVIRGVKFPLNPQRMYEVDLWSPPNDAEFLELLAHATICYRSAGCTVTLGRIDWGRQAMPMRVAMRR